MDLNTRCGSSIRCGITTLTAAAVADSAINRLGLFDLPSVCDSLDSIGRLQDLCSGGKAWFQQDDAWVIRCGPIQRLRRRICDWGSILGRFPVGLQVGWRPLRSVAHGLLVSASPG